MARKYDSQGNETGLAPKGPTRLGISGAGVDEIPQPVRQYDSDGNEIDYRAKEKSGQLGPQMKSDSTSGRIGRAVLRSLPDIGGGIGALGFGPIGAAVGGGIGSGLENLEQLKSSTPGVRQEAVSNIMGDALMQGAFEKFQKPLSLGAAKIKDFLTNKVVRSFPIHGNPEPLLKSGLPFSVGQATGGQTAKAVERLFGPEDTRVALAKAQDTSVEDIISKFRVRFGGAAQKKEEEVLGQEGQAAIKKNMAQGHRDINDAFKPVNMDSKAAGITFDVKTGERSVPDPFFGPPKVEPIIEQVKLEGPVITDKTAQFINRIRPDIEKVTSGLPQESPFRGKLDRLLSVMDDIGRGKQLPDGSQLHISEWQTLKQFRSDVNSLIGSIADPLHRGEAGLKKLADIVGEDIDNSVKTLWEKAAPGASARLQEANRVTKEFYDTFTKRVKSGIVIKKGVKPDASKLFNIAEQSPEAASEMIRALGPNEQKAIKSHFFERLLAPETTRPLDVIDNPIYKKVFTQPERADLSYFFKTVDRIKPDESHWGEFGLFLKKAGIVMGLGGSLIEGTQQALGTESTAGKVISRPALAGASAIFLGNKFAKNVLLNPRYARSATRLANLQPDSEEAKYLRKTILTAMRGTDFIVKLASGKEVPATVDSSGEVKLK